MRVCVVNFTAVTAAGTAVFASELTARSSPEDEQAAPGPPPGSCRYYFRPWRCSPWLLFSNRSCGSNAAAVLCPRCVFLTLPVFYHQGGRQKSSLMCSTSSVRKKQQWHSPVGVHLSAMLSRLGHARVRSLSLLSVSLSLPGSLR